VKNRREGEAETVARYWEIPRFCLAVLPIERSKREPHFGRVSQTMAI
jgi:hypothetical protein